MKLATVAVVLACACGGSAKKPAPAPSNQPVLEAAPPPPVEDPPVVAPAMSDEAFEAMMAQAVAMFTAMGAAADAAGADCGKLADGIDQVMGDNQPFIASMAQYKDDEAMDKRAQEWMQGHMDEVMQPMMKVGTAGQQCASDPKFQATMKRFEEMN